nr:MAG TPA: hypothetical protein [Caudoviricetes sp.]
MDNFYKPIFSHIFMSESAGSSDGLPALLSEVTMWKNYAV